jgi:hypothetical protein
MTYQLIAISVQVTFDGGSELGVAFRFSNNTEVSFFVSARSGIPLSPFSENHQYTHAMSRETFAPDLSTQEWKPVVAVKSSSKIPIESTWSYDPQFNGRSLRDILEEGRIHLICSPAALLL